jgi:KaiC/GvpD/RAD55 family RecA-like ATPase
MPLEIHVPIFSDLVPGGFTYGTNYLVEYQPSSLWYEASLTITARALKTGLRTHYHTFMRTPGEVREGFQRLGIDLKRLEGEDRFRLIDSCTGLTGLPIQPESRDVTKRLVGSASLNDPSWLESFTANIVTLLEKGAPETDKRWLHIDDNTSIFNRYFKEQDVLNIFHTRVFPLTRLLELSAFHSVVAGVWSDSFYKQFEAQCDGVIDFKAEEDDGQLENYVRVRSIRGKSCDSRWRHLRLEGSGEIVLDKPDEGKKKEIGISGWLKDPRKNRDR